LQGYRKGFLWLRSCAPPRTNAQQARLGGQYMEELICLLLGFVFGAAFHSVWLSIRDWKERAEQSDRG